MKLSQESKKLIVRLFLIGSLLNLIGYSWFFFAHKSSHIRVNTNHLSPTVAKGDLTVVERPKTIERADLVLYLEDSRNIISCIVGVPHDSVEISNGQVITNGSIASKSCLPADLPIMESLIYVVPHNQYLVFDNAESGDLNLINKEKIISKVSHVYHLTNMQSREYLSVAAGIVVLIIIFTPAILTYGYSYRKAVDKLILLIHILLLSFLNMLLILAFMFTNRFTEFLLLVFAKFIQWVQHPVFWVGLAVFLVASALIIYTRRIHSSVAKPVSEDNALKENAPSEAVHSELQEAKKLYSPDLSEDKKNEANKIIEQYYEVLGIPIGATLEEVKLSYKERLNCYTNNRLSSDYKVRKEAQDKIIELNIAFEKIKTHIWNLYNKENEPANNGVAKNKVLLNQTTIRRSSSLSSETKAISKLYYALIGSVIILSIGLGLFYYVTKYHKSWPQLIVQTRRSVVTIKTPTSYGTGFIISPDGTIITNSHLFDEKYDDISVHMPNNEVKKGHLIKAGTPPLDITILKIDGSNYDVLKLADSSECLEGEEVLALGAPRELNDTATRGIVSKCNRILEGENNINYVQTDASISPGNSGGPLINKRGDAIGLLTFKVTAKGFEGLAFAISSKVVKDFTEGKLADLEEQFREKEAERKRNKAEAERKLIESAEVIYSNLYAFWKDEYAKYYGIIDSMVRNRLMTSQDGRAILLKAIAPPSDHANIDAWLTSLTVRLFKKELTAEEAFRLIKSHFTI